MNPIIAKGASVRPNDLQDHWNRVFRIDEYGAGPETGAVTNTRIINDLIGTASDGGGVVLVPAGIYPVYTIRMQSDVTLHLERGAVLRAAVPGEEGGNYDEPEENRYAGIQDHGHSYLANSLVYGMELENIAITGPGVLDGSNYHSRRPGEPLSYILNRWDPAFPEKRNEKGHKGTWFGNKGIALDGCSHIVLTDFTFLIGGHFALILSGCRDIWIDGILVDTIRDALDLDSSQDISVYRSVFNSLNDDAICLKASFGAKKFMPVHNVWIEDCRVYGYDAGSVFAGEFTRDKLTATDRCKPCGRLKFGTEASCGLDTVYVRNVTFERSRGICFESCDTADMHDIVVEDIRMKEISSSPIFVRLGNRNRFPVTGLSDDERLSTVKSDPVNPEGGEKEERADIRLDHREWILPNRAGYDTYGAVSYTPSVNRTKEVSIDGVSFFSIPDPENPCQVNPANFEVREEAGEKKYYLRRWDGNGYAPDYSAPVDEKDLCLYANACGGAGGNRLARAWNILFRRIEAIDVDPRYPIILEGLSDSPVRDIVLEDIRIRYRGGITREMAVEQRQLNTRWNFSQFGAERDAQILPWLVNTFFAKSEGLLPRADWDRNTSTWVPNPYNVPELCDLYPEPSNYGILPAYGIYARHMENLVLANVTLETESPDERDSVVLDDVSSVKLEKIQAEKGLVCIASGFRRPTGLEMVPDYPYHRECVKGIDCDGSIPVSEVKLPAPAPGTPPDSQYPYPTAAVPENGYAYAVPTSEYPLPRSIYRPYVVAETGAEDAPGTITLVLRDPAGDYQDESVDGTKSGEILVQDPVVAPKPAHVSLALLCVLGEKKEELVRLSADEKEHRYTFALPKDLPEGTSLRARIEDSFRTEWQEVRPAGRRVEKN